MRSHRMIFDEFRMEFYPHLRGAGLLALRRAFMAGYGAHAEHALEIINDDGPLDDKIAKTTALMLSGKSFVHDCDTP